MRRPALLLAALALAEAGCNGGTKQLPPHFQGPTAIAVFRGFTGKRPGQLHEYLAVANSRADDLRFVDTEDEQLVMSPTVVFPLSLPTREAYPARLLAVALGAEATPGADLLLVVGAGSRLLEVVETWGHSSRIAAVVDAGGALDDGHVLLALAAAPPGEPGRARVYASLSGSKLAVIDFLRGPGGEIAAGTPAVLDLAVGGAPFEAIDLAVAPAPVAPPDDPPPGARPADRVFAATVDPVGPGVFGVARLDVTRTDPVEQSGATVGLDAQAPTRLVATARLAERDLDAPERNPDAFLVDPAKPGRLLDSRKVYAYLDPASCGFSHPIDCGLATLDPETGLVPDPMGREPFRSPIPIPTPAAILPLEQADPEGVSRIGLASFASSSGRANTTALAAIAGPDAVYFADLGRFSLANQISFVSADTGAAVTSVAVEDTGDQNFLDLADVGVSPTQRSGTREGRVRVRPGFVESDTWTVSWQGSLPGFAGPAVVGRDAGGGWLAFQVDSGLVPPPAVQWLTLARLDMPELGVRLGDLAEILESPVSGEAAACTGTDPAGGFRTRITAFLPPSADYPGGAVRLGSLDCLDGKIAVGEKRLVSAQIRTAGVLLTGASFGYAGRPQINVDYTLEWAPDAGLDPEALALARKCRRRHYPPSLGNAALLPGPLLQLRVTKVAPTGGTPSADPPTGQVLTFVTRSGFLPMARVPILGTSSGTRPVGLAVARREVPAPSDLDPAPVDPSYFYAVFESGLILRIPQGASASEVKVIQ